MSPLREKPTRQTDVDDRSTRIQNKDSPIQFQYSSHITSVGHRFSYLCFNCFFGFAIFLMILWFGWWRCGCWVARTVRHSLIRLLKYWGWSSFMNNQIQCPTIWHLARLSTWWIESALGSVVMGWGGWGATRTITALIIARFVPLATTLRTFCCWAIWRCLTVIITCVNFDTVVTWLNRPNVI